MAETRDEVEARMQQSEPAPVPEDAADREGTFGVDFDTDAPVLTANQVVAYNVQRARRAHGWTQDYLGQCLEKLNGRVWSRASVSAAESSWRGGRTRRFDANEILAFAVIFDLPVASFFVPPSEDELEDAVFVADSLGDFGLPIVTREGLTRLTYAARPPGSDRSDEAAPLPLNSETIKAVLQEMEKQGLVLKSVNPG